MKKLHFLWIIPLVLLFSIFLLRLILPSEIDDVSPGISCPEISKYNPDLLWVIPDFNGVPINKSWCEEILLLNKSLGMHGINHTYNEFLGNISQEDLERGIFIFRNCFNQIPTKFKPPQLEISEKNKKLILGNNLSLKLNFNQFFHKVYHCEDTGVFPNWLVRIF